MYYFEDASKTALFNALDDLSQKEQWEKYTFDHFPAERILFGTDAPISFLHGKSVEINHQYVYMSPENFNLGTSLYDNTGKITYVPFLYEQIRSILSLDLPGKVLEDFFFHNAYSLYTQTVERMKK